jgi:hypothetical protein
VRQLIVPSSDCFVAHNGICQLEGCSSKVKFMSKTAFVILASADNPESLGRVVNALTAAHELIESGQEIEIIFDGAGSKAAATLSAERHRYHDLFNLVKSKVSGVCRYCAKAYGRCT